MSRSVYFAQREHLHNGPKWPPCEQASGSFPIAVTACERQRDDEAVRNGISKTHREVYERRYSRRIHDLHDDMYENVLFSGCSMTARARQAGPFCKHASTPASLDLLLHMPMGKWSTTGGGRSRRSERSPTRKSRACLVSHRLGPKSLAGCSERGSDILDGHKHLLDST
jgi:hypothetical protein